MDTACSFLFEDSLWCPGTGRIDLFDRTRRLLHDGDSRSGGRDLDLHLTNGNDVTHTINIGDIPTEQQVFNETHRLLQIQRAQENSGGGGPKAEEYCDALVRQYKIVSVRSNHEIRNNNVAILIQLQQIQDQLDC